MHADEGAADVDADIVARRVVFGQRNGVFALAAAQFEYDRTVVMEKVAVPMSFERMVAAEGLLEGGLYETFEREVLRKRLSLSLPICFYSLFAG